MIDSETCWAKTDEYSKAGMSVYEHCRIVGLVAQALIQRLPRNVSAIMPHYSALVAAMHDVGKISPGFQFKISATHLKEIFPEFNGKTFEGFERRHSIISQACINRFLKERFQIAAVARIAGAHHGFWQAGQATDRAGNCGGEAWGVARERLLKTLINEFGEVQNERMSDCIRYLLAGLVTVADWIGSDEKFFSPSGLPADSDIRLLADTALSESGWTFPRIKKGLSFEEIFDGKTPNAIQNDFVASVNGPGLYILEAPMGCGKTEAALYAAYRLMCKEDNYGLYFGLPTRLTSDKIHERVQLFLEKICSDKTHARLAHGLAWLKEFEYGGKGFKPYGLYSISGGREEEEPETSWFNPKKRALLWPFSVGTIDQALMGVIRVKHHFVRLFGLAGKVVILDELHSYDFYTGSLVDKLIELLLKLNCTVIVLSATLSGKRRAQLVSGDVQTNAYPLVLAKKDSEVILKPGMPMRDQNYEICVGDMTPSEVAAEAERLAHAGNCVLCVANTVEQAQIWYQAVKSSACESDFQVGLLHSKFPAFRRDELESEWLAKLGAHSAPRPPGCVLVATQVVEQSVDIDADCLITELAPTDMLLQRIGRVWRHPQKTRCLKKPLVKIICGNADDVADHSALISALGGKSCFVYQPYVLWRSWRVWNNLSSLAVPGRIRELIEATYSDNTENESSLIHDMRMKLKKKKEELLQYAVSAGVETNLPPEKDEDMVATRYSERPVQNILVVKSVCSYGKDLVLELLDGGEPLRLTPNNKDFTATRRLHRQIVTVPKYLFKKLGAYVSPQLLRMHFHELIPVWELRDEFKPLMMDGKNTGYTYDKWIGLRRVSMPDAEPEPFDDYEDCDLFKEEWD